MEKIIVFPERFHHRDVRDFFQVGLRQAGEKLATPLGIGDGGLFMFGQRRGHAFIQATLRQK
jgi:hypothetical protein